MNISINIPDELAKQVQQYAVAHGTSVDELTAEYFNELISLKSVHQEDIPLSHRESLDKRWQAYKNGKVELVSKDEFNAEISEHLASLRA